VREQLSNIVRSLGLNPNSSCSPEREPILRCIAKGLSRNIANRTYSNDDRGGASRKRSRSESGSLPSAPYVTVMGRQPVHIHPSSSIFVLPPHKHPKHVVFAEILVTSRQYMRFISAFDIEWVPSFNLGFIQCNPEATTSTTTPTDPRMKAHR
jgi:hypothetical protein